jgi:hypothetical protein
MAQIMEHLPSKHDTVNLSTAPLLPKKIPENYVVDDSYNT